MALHLITGYAGQEHITSADQGAYNEATFGSGQFVLNRGQKFRATILTNNSIQIADGEAMLQGRYIKMATGATETLSIDNGTSGYKRIDRIVIRYSKDTSTSVESASLVVIKGASTTTTPSAPAYTTGNITDGDDVTADMPLYTVNIDGINITSVVSSFVTKTSMVDYMDNYQMPAATVVNKGAVRVGDGLNVATDGTLSVPTASYSTKGIAKVGYSGVDIDSNGFLKIASGRSGYTGNINNQTLVSQGTFTVPWIYTNAYGQVTSGGERTLTMPRTNNVTFATNNFNLKVATKIATGVSSTNFLISTATFQQTFGTTLSNAVITGVNYDDQHLNMSVCSYENRNNYINIFVITSNRYTTSQSIDNIDITAILF